MKNKKLIRLLSSFSKKEMRDFEKFAASQYFNKGRNYLPLLKVLKKFHPAFDNIKLNEEFIYKMLYPQKKYSSTNASTLRSVFSRLGSLAEKFILYNNMENGKLDYFRNTALAEMYRRINLPEEALKIFLENSKQIDKEEKNESYYRHRLETNIYLFNTYYILNKPEKVYEFSNNILLYNYAFIFHVMVGYFNLSAAFKKRYNFSYKGLDLIKQFVSTFDPELFDKECDSDKFETKKVLLLFFYILKSRIETDPKESLSRALDLYEETFIKLSRTVQWDIYTVLYNRLVGNINSDHYYLQRANNLIDFVWEKGVISHNNNLNLDFTGYESALNVKLVYSDINEIRRFINKYSVKVEKSLTDSIKDYSLALLCFKEGLFGKCLEYLSKKDLLGINFINRKYKLQICCLFELGHYNDSLRVIDSYQHFLRNNKGISDSIRNEGLLFTKGIKRLINFKSGTIVEHDLEFKEIIAVNRNSIFGPWFEKNFKVMNK